MKSYRLYLAVLIIFVLGFAGSVQAQTSLTFDSVQVQLWPEYDQPSMLVIYTFELPQEQALPVEFSVRIPARAGEPTAVAVLEGDSLITNDYTRTEIGEWAEISLVTDSPVIQIEYYDPALSQDDQPRTYQLNWDFDYPVNDFILSFKQPFSATNIQFQPDLGPAQAGGDGLNFFSSSFGRLPGGQNFIFELSYQKSDTTLAAQPPAPPPADTQTQPEPAAGFQSNMPAWGWALIGAGAALLIGVAVYFLRGRQSSAAQSSYRQKKQRSRTTTGAGAFCHQCGVQARRGDKFCRECGSELRL